MIERLDTRLMIRPEDVEPSDPSLQVVGVYNPAIAELDDGTVIILARVVEAPVASRDQFVPLPVYDVGDRKVNIDWVPENSIDRTDPRVVSFFDTKFHRLTFLSHLMVFTSRDGKTVDGQGARIFPELPVEEYGLEDPRATKIDDTWWITYVGVSRAGITTNLMSTKDFKTFERHGIMLPRENKDVLLFPEKVGGRYATLHRPTGTFAAGAPQMWVAYSPDLTYWGDHHVLRVPRGKWGGERIGGGVPPYLTDRGWVEIYHGATVPEPGQAAGTYSAGALLLDRDDPTKILASTSETVMAPVEDFEKEGFLDNVVFPTGVVRRGENLLIYYGASDAYTAVVEVRESDLLDALEPVDQAADTL